MMNIKGRRYGEGEAEFFRISIMQRPRNVTPWSITNAYPRFL